MLALLLTAWNHFWNQYVYISYFESSVLALILISIKIMIFSALIMPKVSHLVTGLDARI